MQDAILCCAIVMHFSLKLLPLHCIQLGIWWQKSWLESRYIVKLCTVQYKDFVNIMDPLYTSTSHSPLQHYSLSFSLTLGMRITVVCLFFCLSQTLSILRCTLGTVGWSCVHYMLKERIYRVRTAKSLRNL